MMPSKELSALVRALMQTPEYTEMMRVRKKVMENMQLARYMNTFEREHARIQGLNITEAERAERLKRLSADYSPMLEREEVKGFTTAVRQYQKMLTESIAYINHHLDPASPQRPY